jgi:EAL domain-containing protein (putative c-di-GMP-specific phosphodiesterase class I)
VWDLTPDGYNQAVKPKGPSDKITQTHGDPRDGVRARSHPVPSVFSLQEVSRALAADEFVLQYQPIVEVASGRVRGVEALIRWLHPSLGLLGPDAFLPAIEETPIMDGMTRWVLRASCAAAADWPEWTVSVNITGSDLASDSFAVDVERALDSGGIAPDRLVLELTETALVQDLPRAAGVLAALRDTGVGVALDDFGTGYSSMLYLRELPLTSVKIDRVFTAGLPGSSDDVAIVTSLLTLARTVGLTTVAEGVENELQAHLLDSLGCPLAQGFLWSRPVALAEATEIHQRGLSGVAYGLPAKPQRKTPYDPNVAARVDALLRKGASLNTIAAALNNAGIRTANGTRWHAASVARLINTLR